MMITKRYSRRQNHVRRRATTSSSAISRSTPYMLGHGSIRRASTSISPRKAITLPIVAATAPSSDSPSLSYRTTKNSGLVNSATAVAARLRRRHSPASIVASSPTRRDPVLSSA